MLTIQLLQLFMLSMVVLSVASARRPREQPELLSGGFTIGALVGGTLVSLLSRRAAFLINIPVTVAILLCTPFAISAGQASQIGPFSTCQPRRRPRRTFVD